MKPADLYVGVLDLFSILLPGSLVAWTVWRWAGGKGTALARFLPDSEAAGWAAFLLVAFGAGHVIFLLASHLDETFDVFRRMVLQPMKQERACALDKAAYEAANALREASLGIAEAATAAAEAAAAVTRGKVMDSALEVDARRLRETRTWALTLVPGANIGARSPSVAGPNATNTYQWSRAVLRLRVPQAYADVQKLEADSKFFRSLCLVLAVATVASVAMVAQVAAVAPVLTATGPSWLLPGEASLVLALLCYWRYAELRDKGINEAYRAVIVLFTSPAPARSG